MKLKRWSQAKKIAHGADWKAKKDVFVLSFCIFGITLYLGARVMCSPLLYLQPVV